MDSPCILSVLCILVFYIMHQNCHNDKNAPRNKLEQSAYQNQLALPVRLLYAITDWCPIRCTCSYIDHLLDKKTATFVMGRGCDNIEVMKKVLKQEDNFIIRLKRNRNLLYQNKMLSVHNLAIRRKGKVNFRSEIKGIVYDLKFLILRSKFPPMKGKRLTMVAVYM